MNKWEHIIQKFNERFSPQDFIHKSKVWGEIDFKEEIVTAIVDAPNKGELVKIGKGENRVIYRIKLLTTKAVYVVWDKTFSVPITVLTGEMKALSGTWSD